MSAGVGNALVVSVAAPSASNFAEHDFWLIWDRQRSYLFNCCLRWLSGNHADAEDVLSMASLKARQKIFEGRHRVRNLEAWLFRLVRNSCLDFQRSRTRGLRAAETLSKMPHGWRRRFTGQGPTETPYESYRRDEMRRGVCRAVKELPDWLRQPTILRFYLEMPYKEIAQALNITNANARKRVQKAREILKGKLGRLHPDLP